MNEIVTAKQRAIANGMCEEYVDKWNEATSLHELVGMMSEAKGMPFIAKAFMDGWLPDMEYIKATLSDYINGAEVFQHDGYTGEIWCGVDDANIELRATVTLVAGCRGRVYTGKRSVCRLYITGGSDVEIVGAGKVFYTLYSGSAMRVDSGAVCVPIQEKAV